MDELADAVKMDPLEFRLTNLTDERFIRVLKAAADAFGWGKKQPAKPWIWHRRRLLKKAT